MRRKLVFVSKVGSKGVVFIPKAIREDVGVNEKDLIIIESDGEKITIRPVRVTRVKASRKIREVIEEALSEEYELEEAKADRLAGQ